MTDQIVTPIDLSTIPDDVRQKILDEGLKDIKSKLDSAYSARDAAITEAATLKEAQRQQEIARLQAEGKDKEAAELQLKAEKARADALEETNTRLTRDAEVRTALLGYKFRTVAAARTAANEVTIDLVRDQNGVWVHKSGITIDAAAKKFLSDPENEYLLQPKENSGSGLPPVITTQTKDTNTSIFALPQDQVMAGIKAGTIKRRGR